MDNGFYKVSAILAPAPVPGLQLPHKNAHGQQLPTSGTQVLKSSSRDSAVQVLVTSHEQMLLWLLWSVHHCKRISVACQVEPAALQTRVLWSNLLPAVQVGRDSEPHPGGAYLWIPLEQCNPRLGILGEDSTLGRWHPLLGYMCVRLHFGIAMAPVPLVLNAEATQLSFPLLTPGPPKLPLLHQSSSECLQISRSMCRLLKRVSGFPVAFSLTKTGIQSLLIFFCQILWELLFPAQHARAGNPGVGLGPLPLLGDPLPPKCLSWCSTSICGF